MSKFDPAGFLIFFLVFVSRDFELGRNVCCDFAKSRQSVAYGPNLFVYLI